MSIHGYLTTLRCYYDFCGLNNKIEFAKEVGVAPCISNAFDKNDTPFSSSFQHNAIPNENGL